MIAALDSGHLSAAVLDVFRQEPLPQDHPFWQHLRILVNHLALSIDFTHLCDKPRSQGLLVC